MSTTADPSVSVDAPPLATASRVWARIGLLSFGGPAAQIGLMHKEVVDERRWLSEKQYVDALGFCMLLPGPEAMQLATYAGWRMHGVAGGLVAGLWFVMPGALVVLLLAVLYGLYGNLPLAAALFLGIKAAVLVIVLQALLRVASRTLVSRGNWVIALLAFVALFFLAAPYPLVIAAAALVGWWRGRHDAIDAGVTTAVRSGVQPRETFRTIVLWLGIWWLPILLLAWWGQAPLLTDIALFFSQLAIVTFGGAYAVLAYLAQDVVSQHGWLSAGEMMDGLGLAETTPGPLILVTEFVGYLAAFREGGLAWGLAGAVVTLWVTFVPCFLWIFAGAPYIEWIGTRPRLQAALGAITAAVVGVIANLSLWFALHVFFDDVEAASFGLLRLWLPAGGSLDLAAVALSLLCAVLLLRLQWSVLRTLAVSSTLGLLLGLLPRVGAVA